MLCMWRDQVYTNVLLCCEARTEELPAVHLYLSKLCKIHGVPLRDIDLQLQLPVGHAEGSMSVSIVVELVMAELDGVICSHARNPWCHRDLQSYMSVLKHCQRSTRLLW